MYNAYVTTIKNLRKHPNADRLKLGECFGNTVCVSMEYTNEQIGIYFPTDGQLSIEFADANNLLRKKDAEGNNIGGYMDPDKRNITSIRLRGEKSDGLFLPLSCLESFGDISVLNVGDIITTFYGCCILDGRDRGYNMTRGGEGSSSIDINKMRELWDKGLSINEIAEQLNCNRHSIYKRIHEYKNCNSEEIKKRKYNLISQSRKKEVYQYDLNGDFIAKYDSIGEASEKTGIGYSTIRSNVQGKSKSAGGYQFVYKNKCVPYKYNVKGNGYDVSVIQLDLQYNFVKEFNTLKDAAEDVGLSGTSSLSLAIKDVHKIVKGYHWIVKSDYDQLHEADLAAH